MAVWLYRAFGGLVLAGVIFTLGTGFTFNTHSDTLPDGVRNTPGAFRGYFILYGGK